MNDRDGVGAADNKNKISEMLERRHKERQHNIDSAQESKKKDTDVTENVDYFLKTFTDRVRGITHALDNLECDSTSTPLALRFDVIAKDLQLLQNYLSSSTLFLPDSVVKRFQRELSDLTANLDATKSKLIPKKKFGFRSKGASGSTAKLTQKAVGPIVPSQKIEWTVKNINDQEILLEHDAVNGKDLTMTSLTNCLVRIVGHPGSLQLSNITNCLVISGPVARSVFTDNCIASTLVFGCQQFRLHTSVDCNIYMQVTCRGIIEDCKRISFAPYTFSYDDIDLDFVKAGLDISKNNWDDVADFNWLSADKVSPNWTTLAENELITDWTKTIEEFRAKLMTPKEYPVKA